MVRERPKVSKPKRKRNVRLRIDPRLQLSLTDRLVAVEEADVVVMTPPRLDLNRHQQRQPQRSLKIDVNTLTHVLNARKVRSKKDATELNAKMSVHRCSKKLCRNK
jgi:hypothetical protein